jgi:hypothetical protein
MSENGAYLRPYDVQSWHCEMSQHVGSNMLMSDAISSIGDTKEFCISISFHHVRELAY